MPAADAGPRRARARPARAGPPGRAAATPSAGVAAVAGWPPPPAWMRPARCCGPPPPRAWRWSRGAPAPGWTGALPPHRCDLVVDTLAVNQVLEHAAGDLVVRVQAGVDARAARPRCSARPGSSSRWTRPAATAQQAHGRRRAGDRAGRAAAAALRDARGTWSSGSPWSGPTARWRTRAARWSRTWPGTTWASCSPAQLRDARPDRRGGVPAAPAARRDGLRHRRACAARRRRGRVSAAAGLAARARRRRRSTGPRPAARSGSACCSRATRTGWPSGPPGWRGARAPAPGWRRSRQPGGARSGVAPDGGGTLIRLGFWAGRLAGVLGAVDRAAAVAGLDPAVGGSAAAGVLHARLAADAGPAACRGSSSPRCGPALALGGSTLGGTDSAGRRAARAGQRRRAARARRRSASAVDMWGPVPSAGPDAGGQGPVRPGAPDGTGPLRRRDLMDDAGARRPPIDPSGELRTSAR